MESELGFVCDRCGVSLAVYYTRKREGKIARVRKCPGCGETVGTIEKKLWTKFPKSSISGTEQLGDCQD